MPEVSIILPVYNGEPYLYETLSALCGQAYRDFELLAVDDGSTDQSRPILERFAGSDPRIIVLAQRHGGVSAARNLALHAAKGKWIWFADCDDLPFADFLYKTLQEKNIDEADILAGSFVKIKTDGRFQRISAPEHGLLRPGALPDCFMQTQYETGYFGYLWNKLIRREKILKTSAAFNESMPLAEDLEFMLQLYRAKSRVLFVPHCAVQYTEHPLHGAVDFFSQFKLQAEIAQWILSEQKRTEYTRFFQKKLSDYAAFSVLYAEDAHKNPLDVARQLIEIRSLPVPLSEHGLHGIFRPIVRCLRQKNVFALRLCLFGCKAAHHTLARLKGGFHHAVRSV